jgi:cytidylate kinase
MSVVTIRGKLGSGASEIGKLVANKLHTDYVDREIIAEVAERLRRSTQEITKKEMPSGSLGGRILEALSYGFPEVGFAGAYLPAGELPLDDTKYLAGLEFVIKKLAASSSIVIRGRGSEFILKDYPGALHVLVVASLSKRVKRVMESLKIDEESAKKEIVQSDSSRRQFIERYFHAEMEAPIHYDLVLNTDHLTYEDAASIVVNAIPFKERASPKDSC